MQKFVRNLLTEWRRLNLPFSDKTIITAVSGGADSTSMASALNDLVKRKKLENNFVIAHFNHKLRGEQSDADAEFVRNLAAQLSFEFILGNAENKPKKNENIEQWARDNRYEFLLKTAEKQNSDIILTAHTINDQAETFLINLLRGSGLDGLSGMKPIRKFEESDKILLVRPMLNWAEREQIKDFIKTNNIKFRKDSMNDDLNYQRVKIRKSLTPELKKINPRIVFTLADSAKLIADDAQLLSELAAEKIRKEKIIDKPYLRTKSLQNCSKAMLYRILRTWLKENRGDLKRLELKNIEAIEHLLFSTKSGKIVELPGFGRVIKEDGKLSFHNTMVEK